MAHWFEQRSIRARIVMLTLAILLPVAATLAWFLASDVRRARESAHAAVRLLATGTATELQHLFGESEQMLSRLADRPLVRAMDAGACDPLVLQYRVLGPDFATLSLRDAHGRIVCGPPAAALAPLDGDDDLAAGLASGGGLRVGGIRPRAGSGEPVVVWRYPVRPAAGAALGQLVLEIDLQALNRQLLSAVPAQAVVIVTDASRTILLRSAEPAAAIGQRPDLDAADPARGAREGFFEGAGLDGRARLYAEVDVPGLGWRVMAGLPVDHVFEGYRHVLKRTIAIGVVLGLGALALAWRLSAAIVRPVADLRSLVARVAAGDVSARSPATGPPELRAVAQAFNQMLDARALSESRLRGIFEAAVDAIITADEQQTIVEANPAAAAMFRCRLDEMVGAPLERFIPLRYRAAHQRDVQRFGEATLAARHMGAQRDVMALRADGEEFPIEASISHVSVGGRRLFTVIHRDVTERRRVEAALSQSESRLRRLLIHLPEAVYVSRGEHISFANHAAQRLFGTDEAGLLGHSPLEFIHDASQAAVTAHLAGLGEGAPVTTLAEVQVQRADGSLRWAQSLATLVEGDADGSVLVVMRDVTDLRQVQAALQASHADLTRLVAALDSVQEEERKRIARELHDDLQQTLAAIRMDIGAAGADLAGSGAAPPPTLARIDELAAAAIASTRRIINDLRPQMLEELGLLAALEALAEQFERRHRVRCEVVVADLPDDDAGIDPKVANGLYRVAQEALNNIAKHAQAGQVRLQLSRVAGDRLHLVVHDDGCGLSDADLRKPQSFGLLGMQERLRALGGTLQVGSAAGRGTTLEVEVPMAGR